MTQRETFEKVKCSKCPSRGRVCESMGWDDNCFKYKEYLESLNEQMLEVLKEIHEISQSKVRKVNTNWLKQLILQVEGKEEE